jgi:hypothetical protein
MSGFTKLVPEIIQSSIWNESPEVRCVWITMLATKDADGYVRGDAKTLARLANVELAHAEEALRKFQEPDPSSHTPDNDGRRIAQMPGGWVVLNHQIYRQRDHNEDHASYMREWRVKKRESQVNHASASASVSASPEGMQGEGQMTTAYSPDVSLPTMDDFKAAAVGVIIAPADVEACYHYWAAAGFMRNGTRLVNWKSLLAQWAARSREMKPKRKGTGPNI